MPFTTINNYNWLLNVDGVAAENTMPNRIYQQAPISEVYSANIGEVWEGRARQSQNQDVLETSDFTSSLQDAGLLPGLSNPNQVAPTMTERFQAQFTQAPVTEGFISSTHDSTPNQSSSGSHNTQYRAPGASQKPIAECQQSHLWSALSRPQQRNTTPNQLQAFRSSSNSRNLPTVDEVSRNQVLDIIVQSGPQTPDGAIITRDHHLLTLSSLQNYCDLFFSRFNVSYPLLHQATFDASQVDPLLLISVILLGATYADKASHRLAVCIHDELRAKIFQNAAFKAQPTLWMLQTILLVECFGKSRAGQTQHDMAHLFHGLLIKYVKMNMPEMY